MSGQPFGIRPARREDVAQIFEMIHELAVFEKLDHIEEKIDGKADK